MDMLDGMFSFVLLDTRDKSFIAARDAIGITPLYMGWGLDGRQNFILSYFFFSFPFGIGMYMLFPLCNLVLYLRYHFFVDCSIIKLSSLSQYSDFLWLTLTSSVALILVLAE